MLRAKEPVGPYTLTRHLGRGTFGFVQSHHRLAFTLVEMLVVITIILILTAIGVMAIPSVQERSMQSGADQLQGWLFIAKQRAKTEGRPTGLRILFDPATKQASQCQYIYQPDDYAAPGSSCTLNTNTNTVTFTVNLTGSGVQRGDYLEFYRCGGVYPIRDVTATTATLDAAPAALTGVNNPTGKTFEYRIIRQPVLLPGEGTLQLPDGVVIDNNANTSLNVPTRTANGTVFYEVLFSPQGGLVGRGTGSDGLCVLWVSNTRNTSTFPLLVAIQAHTGFIAVHPKNTDVNKSGGSPYANCRDGRASGL
jgi:prepilin-type N-terminal cleavage/methylation domain-containing protein